MQVKKFRATTMQLALNQVRADLGGDAVILNTRTIERGGFFGFRRKSLVEISASIDAAVRRNLPPPPAARARRDPTRPGALRHSGLPAPPPVAPPAAVLAGLDGLRRQVEQLAAQSAAGVSFPAPLRAHYRHLVDRGVHAALARGYLRRIHDEFSAAEQSDALKVRLHLIEEMRQTLRVSGPPKLRTDGPTTVVLLGPTGVGKTTTIAKLAAEYAIAQRRRVALVTCDTYRIAAVEQLRVYADIIDLPLEVAMTPGDLRTALARVHDVDVVLMDTAGRSPHDSTKLRELEAMLHAAEPDHVVLCLSATTHSDDIPLIVDRFSIMPPTHIILTKLDETLRPGWILNTCQVVDAPVAYVTTGQNVPDDIELADATRLVGRILGGGGGL